MRLDVYLIEKGLVPSRQRAVCLIKSGAVKLDGIVTLKPSADTGEKNVEVTGEDLRYVSRGGLKLEGALDAFGISPSGRVCLDLGASTGGFTDCLLQRGAKRVYAIDVGSRQLHPKLLEDKRVISREHFNARNLCAGSLPERIFFAVSDLSFISQRLIYAPLVTVFEERAILVSLIKPQFEAGKAALNRKGLVKDLKEHVRVIKELRGAALEHRLHMKKLCRSPIDGGDGNREYLALFVYGEETSEVPDEDIIAAVYGRGKCD